MKKSIVLLAAITLSLTTTISAKKLPATAAKLPADFKQEITKHIDYPKAAQTDLIEGEVWMKVTLDESSTVRIVDLSATNQDLGKHVREELENLKIENTSFKNGTVYFMKVKFDLLD